MDAGKSTLLGVLTHGELDNGRGFARQKLFRHKHEIESGRTSSVGNDILGFDSEGNVVNKPDSHGGSLEWTKICEKSTKVITFIDLAGHEKYLKTTVFGMTGHLPDFCMLMVCEGVQGWGGEDPCQGRAVSQGDTGWGGHPVLCGLLEAPSLILPPEGQEGVPLAEARLSFTACCWVLVWRGGHLHDYMRRCYRWQPHIGESLRGPGRWPLPELGRKQAQPTHMCVARGPSARCGAGPCDAV